MGQRPNRVYSLAEPTSDDWERCTVADCGGVCINGTNVCPVHASGPKLAPVLAAIAEGNLDLRGCRLSREKLEQFLSLLPEEYGRKQINSGDFREAEFTSYAKFNDVLFATGTRFMRARFPKGANFAEAAFEGFVYFDGATFGRDTTFERAIFDARASFVGCSFGDLCSFQGTVFTVRPDFEDSTFGRNMAFVRAQFALGADFSRIQMGDSANFSGVDFGDATIFGNARFGESCRFVGAQLGDASYFDGSTFGPFVDFGQTNFGAEIGFEGCEFGTDSSFRDATFRGDVTFAGSTFAPRTRLQIRADGGTVSFERTNLTGLAEAIIDASVIDFRRAVVSQGGTFIIRSPVLRLEGTSFRDPTTFSGGDDARGRRAAVPSLKAADSSNLVLADIDLSRCWFSGTHHLDALRFEGDLSLGRTPPGLFIGNRFPFVWSWTRRYVIAEERLWRGAQARGRAWRSPLDDDNVPTAEARQGTRRFAEEILRGARDRIEARYRIIIRDEALAEAVDRALLEAPARAVAVRARELVEEAATVARQATISEPDELRELRAEIRQVQIDKVRSIEEQQFEKAASLRDKERKLTYVARDIRRKWITQFQKTEDSPVRPEIDDTAIANLLPSGKTVGARTDVPDAPRPHEIADTYRALRKGREDSKDEPGAADFYYGEMEMRRLSSEPRSAERLLLTVYWSMSGYGLRASRSFLTLLGVLAVGAWLLHRGGFANDHSWPRTLSFTLATATAVFRDSGTTLTTQGEFIQIALRILGPVLLALTVLALRGRVRR